MLFNERFNSLSFDCVNNQLLSDIMSFDNGYAFSSADYLHEGTYKIVTIGNVGDGYIDTSQVNYLNYISNKVRDAALLQVGDVIVSLTGNVGRTAIVRESNLLLNQRVARIVPQNNGFKWFLYCLFRQQSTKTFLETISRGTAQANLSPIELLKTKIHYDINAILEFSVLVTPIISETLHNSNEISNLINLRNTFLTALSR